MAGQPYEKRFAGKEHAVTKQTAVGLAQYPPMLAPGETVDLVFKRPRVPTQHPHYIQAAQAADHGIYRQRTVQYWQQCWVKETTLP